MATHLLLQHRISFYLFIYFLVFLFRNHRQLLQLCQLNRWHQKTLKLTGMLTPISQLHLHRLDYSGLISLSLRNNKRTDEFCNVIETNIRIFFFFIWIGTEVQWMLLTIFRKCNLICVQTANKNTSYTINDQYTYYICIIKWIVCLLNLFSWNNFTRFQCHFSQSIRKNGSYIDIIFVCTNEWCPLWLDKHCPKAIFVANRVANGHIDFCVQTIIAHHLRC